MDLRLNSTACVRCALPLHHSDTSSLCGRCLRRSPYFDRSVVPFKYAYPLDHLIRGLKFRERLSYGRVCGSLFAQVWRAHCSEPPDILVPVPLGERRYRTRGYNQAQEIARTISRALAIPVRKDLVQRVRETSEQVGLKRKERRRNVRGAFVVSKALDAKRVAIVDDVVTTGSTVNEIARVLRRAGAEHVEVWAIARA
jgi:ComF family protein